MGYKVERRTGTLSGVISEAFGELDTLAEEVREWYENLPEGLQSGDKGGTLNEIAETLESIEEPEVPEILADVEVAYEISNNTDRRRPRSRQVRYDDARSMLESCCDAANAWVEETLGATEEMRENARELVDELQTELANCEGCEFPSMF